MRARLEEAARGALETARAAALLGGAAGLFEGLALAFVWDPFGAGWVSRALSLAEFVAAYLTAGALAGALLGFPLRLLSAGRATAPAACAAIGLVYLGEWARALRDVPGAPRVPVALAAAAGALLFGGGGAVAALRTRPIAHRAGTAARAGGIAGLVLIALAAPAALSGRFPPEPDAAAASLAAGEPPARGRGEPPVPLEPARHLLFIVADTLRADHMSLYGYARATSPGLARYARSGTVFTNAITPKTKTSPSVASLLTGTYPHTHGIVNCRTRLPASALTLAEVLRERRFATHSIVANSNVGAGFAFDQGFESVDEIWSDPARSDASGVTDHALSWLRALPGGGDPHPFFLYLQYIDPHAPYAAPGEWADRFVDDAFYGRLSGVRVGPGDDAVGGIRPFVRLAARPDDVDYYVARYDAEVAWLDGQVARLLSGLEETGLLRDTLVIFTADHGEALSEHDVFFAHGGFTYDDTARVPLVIALPGRVPPGRTIDAIVQTAGLAPTALEALGFPPPSSMEVPGFWDIVTGAAPRQNAPEEPAAFIEGDTVPASLRTAIRTRRWKLIENPAGFDRTPGRFDLATVLSISRKRKALELAVTGREFLSRYELYDLLADPAETVNVVRREPEVAARLLARLRSWRESAAGRERLAPASTEELPDEVLRNLRSLGYVQ